MDLQISLLNNLKKTQILKKSCKCFVAFSFLNKNKLGFLCSDS